MTPRTIFVPLALKQELAEALMAAANTVIQSAPAGSLPELVLLKEAYRTLADARDRELMKDRLANGGGLGEIMLERAQRALLEGLGNE